MAGSVLYQSLLSSEANIGIVGGELKVGTVTPTISTSIYASGDQIGDLMEFGDAAGKPNGSGAIFDLIIVDDAEQDAEIELWLFSEDPTTSDAGDNNAFNPSDADLQNIVAIISVASTDYTDANGESCAFTSVRKTFKTTNDQRSLYGLAVVRGAPTYNATDDLTFILKCIVNDKVNS